jgi:hypothetical protein
MPLSRTLWTLANVLGKTSAYLRDAAALSTGDPKIIGQRIKNRILSNQLKGAYRSGGGRRKK